MGFAYGKQDLCGQQRAREVSFLQTDGLGGCASTTAAFSVPRCGQGIPVAAGMGEN